MTPLQSFLLTDARIRSTGIFTREYTQSVFPDISDAVVEIIIGLQEEVTSLNAAAELMHDDSDDYESEIKELRECVDELECQVQDLTLALSVAVFSLGANT